MIVETNNIDELCLLTYIDPQTEISVCGCSAYLEPCPLLLRTAEDFKRIKNKLPGQEILYVLDKRWTIEEAKLYLNELVSAADILFDTSILRIYRPDPNKYYTKESFCEGRRQQNMVAISDFKCTDSNNLILSDKCAYCPIQPKCPVCGCINKDDICYMHQAERIAALIISQSNGVDPDWIFQTPIPYSWVKPFGDSIYDIIYRIRHNIYDIYHDSDLVFNIKMTVMRDFSDADSYTGLLAKIHLSPLIHVEYPDKLCVNIDINTLNRIKDTYGNRITIIEESISHSIIDESIISIGGIYFGPIDDPLTNIPIMDNPELGNPFSLYTYSILYYMKKYINSSTSSVLDIGCGKGTTTIYAKKCGAKTVTGIDINTSAVDAAKVLSIYSNEVNTGINILNEDVFTYIPNTSDKYDVVIGNLCYAMQEKVLPILSPILSDNGFYIAAGLPILIEPAILNVHHDLCIYRIDYVYNSMVITFQKRKEGYNNDNV